MTDLNSTDTGRPAPAPRRPPPTPARREGATGASPGSASSRVKAFLEIRRLRAAEALRRAGAWVRAHKLAAGAIVAAVAVAGAGALAVALDVLPGLPLLAPKTLAEARASARSHPKDAAAQRELGHALFASRHRAAAVAAYRHALSLEAGVADERTVENLVACFGTREQEEAEAVIWKNGLVDAQRRLEPLVSSRSHGVRWGAVQTLDRLKKGTLANWETAYILDLDSPTCDVRRRAVDKLGQIGTQRAVRALRAAKAADDKTDGWFTSPCLGDRLKDAEGRILARR